MNAPLLRLTLLERGLDPDSFAKKAKLGVATVYNMLAGKPVSLRTAYKVSDYLKIPLNEIAPDIVDKYALPVSRRSYKRR